MKQDTIKVIKSLPIKDVAMKLGLKITNSKAMCFNGHDKQTPSLSYNFTDNYWKCFGCGEGGDNISLVMSVLRIDFKTALEWFSHQYCLNVGGKYNQSYKRIITTSTSSSTKNKSKYNEPDKDIYKWFIDKCSAPESSMITSYLKQHGITDEVVKKYKLKELKNPSIASDKLIKTWGIQRARKSGLLNKYDKLIWHETSLIFPFFQNNQVIYLQSRPFLFNNMRKYMNLVKINTSLYNLDIIKDLTLNSTIHICEGVPDTLALISTGLNAVGVIGSTGFKDEYADLFLNFNIRTVPDGDNGGDVFHKKILKLFQKRGMSIEKVHVPEGKDASDVISELTNNE